MNLKEFLNSLWPIPPGSGADDMGCSILITIVGTLLLVFVALAIIGFILFI